MTEIMVSLDKHRYFPVGARHCALSQTSQKRKMESQLSFDQLEKIHARMDWLFYHHQINVLSQNKFMARKHLEEYMKFSTLHMEEEEKYLIPIYEERCGEIRGGAPIIFTGEHEKAQEFFALFKLLMDRWDKSEGPGQETLVLLDHEGRFKALMEHHHLRENRILFPEMDRITTDEEKSWILGQFTFE